MFEGHGRPRSSDAFGGKVQRMVRADAYEPARIHFEVIGSGDREPIVVLPGGGVRSPEYLGDIRRWGSVRQLAVVHYRGTPMSPGLPGPWWNQFDDLEEVRRTLGLKCVDILAHSAGTRVALAYAAMGAPVRRLGLVAPSPTPWLVDTDDDTEALASDRRGEPAIEAALAAGPLELEDETRFYAQQFVTAPLGYARWDARSQRHALLGETNFRALQSFFSAPPPHGLIRRIGELRVPVHIIGGAADLLSGRATVEALSRALFDSSVEFLEASGHYPWVDQPEAFACAVRRWSSAYTE